MADERLVTWERDGVFVVRQVFDAQRIAEIMAVCDQVLETMRARSQATGHTSTHVAGLLSPELYTERPRALEVLVELASSPEVLSLIGDLELPQHGPLSLRDMQYFHEPSQRDYDGEWHRDGDTLDLPRPGGQRELTLLRFRIACKRDDHLEYIPGSQRRPDTPQERKLRRGTVRNTPIDTARRIELEPGDVCVFHTRGIHRARYRHTSQRRTLDLLYRFGTRKVVFDEHVAQLIAARINK